jgi:Na+-driven multidrug efflux pump
VRLIVFLIAGLVNITLAYFFTSIWAANGMALAVLVAEIFVTISFFVYLRSNNLSPV